MVLFGIPAWILLAWLFVLGCVLGSFLNVCVHRIPQHDTLVAQLRGLWSPPSRCPRCFQPILLRDNIPVLGWLLLRGKCRYCRAPISWRYPAVELFNGLLFVLVYWHEVPLSFTATIADAPFRTDFGLSASSFWSDEAILHWRYAYHMLLFEALLVAGLIDLDTMSIPDASTVPATIAGVLLAAAVPAVHVVPVWFVNPSQIWTYELLLPEWVQRIALPEGLRDHAGMYVPSWIGAFPHLHGLVASLTGLVVGGGVVWIVRIIGGWVLRREAMGFGDVILMAVIGSYLGWQATLAVFFVSPLIALAVVAAMWLVRRRWLIPYGPYLSLGALTVVLGWPWIWPSVQRICELGVLVPVMGAIMAVLLAVCLILMQGAKWILGIPLHPPEEFAEGEWKSADTLSYLAGENADRHQGRWRLADWPGLAAGRGTLHQESWKEPAAANGYAKGCTRPGRDCPRPG